MAKNEVSKIDESKNQVVDFFGESDEEISKSMVNFDELEKMEFPDENQELAESTSGNFHNFKDVNILEGLFAGLRPTTFRDGKPGTKILLMNRDKQIIEANANFQIMKFINESQPEIGCYIYLEKLGNVDLPNGNRMTQFKIKYDRKKVRYQLQAMNTQGYQKVQEMLADGKQNNFKF